MRKTVKGPVGEKSFFFNGRTDGPSYYEIRVTLILYYYDAHTTSTQN